MDIRKELKKTFEGTYFTLQDSYRQDDGAYRLESEVMLRGKYWRGKLSANTSLEVIKQVLELSSNNTVAIEILDFEPENCDDYNYILFAAKINEESKESVVAAWKPFFLDLQTKLDRLFFAISLDIDEIIDAKIETLKNHVPKESGNDI